MGFKRAKDNKKMNLSNDIIIKNEIEKSMRVPSNFLLIAFIFFSNLFIIIGYFFLKTPSKYNNLTALIFFFLSFVFYFYLFLFFTLYGFLALFHGFKKYTNIYIAIFIVIFIILIIYGTYHYFEGLKGIIGLCGAVLAGGIPFGAYELYKKYIKKGQ